MQHFFHCALDVRRLEQPAQQDGGLLLPVALLGSVEGRRVLDVVRQRVAAAEAVDEAGHRILALQGTPDVDGQEAGALLELAGDVQGGALAHPLGRCQVDALTETLSLQAQLYRVPRGELEQRVGDLLRIVDLEEAADRRVGTYSGGMQRRLDLAAALVHRPRVVFLDEPTTGLDPISRNTIWSYVQDLNRNQGVTFFLTTQYLEEADHLADEVAIMERGRIVAQGAPAELKASVGADVVTVRLEDRDAQPDRAAAALKAIGGLTDIRVVGDSVVVYTKDGSLAIAPIVLALNEATVAVEEVTLARPTLDDVFLRKTGHHMEAQETDAEPADAEGAAS